MPNDNKPNNGTVCGEKKIRIRKLTPKECWRLMGFEDADHDKAEAVGISNTQRYKQAGNSIVVSVLCAIFGKMIDGKEDSWKELYNKPLNDCEKVVVASFKDNG